MKKKDDFAEKNDHAQAMAFSNPVVSGNIEKINVKTAGEIQAVAEQNACAAKSILPVSSSDLDGVPPEVLKNLTGIDDMVSEERLIGVLSLGFDMSVDKIVLGLYHKYKHIENRTSIITRLNRMAKKGIVSKDPHRRSVYRIVRTEQASQDLAAAHLSAMS